MKIKKQFTIETSADTVWLILGPKYAQIGQWASGVYTSRERTGTILQGAPCSGRVCETAMGRLKETITRYDEQRKVVAYTAQGDKMPFFVRGLSNMWTVTPLNNNRTQVDMCFEATFLPVFNLLMGPIMRMQMGGFANHLTEEFQYFAENGTPHPRKLKAQQKPQLKAAS